MRPQALRGATARKATSNKLKTRLSKGEKSSRKRMAEVGAVYDVEPVPRTAADILPGPGDKQRPNPSLRPRPTRGSPPASCTTPPRWSARSSTKPTAATPTTSYLLWGKADRPPRLTRHGRVNDQDETARA
jgi:hypothetical protein